MSALLPNLRSVRAVNRPQVSAFQAILLVQAAYYALLGLWPILDSDGFRQLLGETTDLPLMRTVSVLLLAVGGCLLLSARKPEPPVEVAFLAVGAAFGLTCLDVIYVAARLSSPVRLVDAAAQTALLLWWAYLALSRASDEEEGRHAGRY
jgi:hypothetical protein